MQAAAQLFILKVIRISLERSVPYVTGTFDVGDAGEKKKKGGRGGGRRFPLFFYSKSLCTSTST